MFRFERADLDWWLVETFPDLARMSVQSSAAPEPVRARLLAGIDAWLAANP